MTRAMVLGSRSHPRQGLLRQCVGPDGREADAPAGETRLHSAPCLLGVAEITMLSIVYGTSEEEIHSDCGGGV